jgi:hypothetical protein
MDTNRQSQKRVWVIAGLLVLALSSTAMTGCQNRINPSVVERQNQTTSGIVNSTFVDVDGLFVTPTKVIVSYPTENVNLGYDTCAGVSQLLDGTLYTFTYHDRSDGYQDTWTTAWDQTTGKKLWSVCTNADTYSATTFHSDGKHLFYVSAVLSLNNKSSRTVTSRSIACLDKATGVTLWKNAMTVASPFIFELYSNITMHINKQSNVVDRVYVLGEEVEQLPLPPDNQTTFLEVMPKVRNPGIYILDGTNGKLLGRIDLPALFTGSLYGGQLLCDDTTLYAIISEPTEVESPAERSFLVAFDLTRNKMLWKESIDGEGTDLVKQGNILVFIHSAASINDWIDVWQIDATATSAKRLWTRKTGESQSAYHVFSFAVDNTFVYLQGDKGTLRALELTTGNEAWEQRFASYKTGGWDMPQNLYPNMTLTITRDILYVEDGGGLVAALDPATGDEFWNKRISQVGWGQTHTANMFVMQVVDKGLLIIAWDGNVKSWAIDAESSAAAEKVIKEYYKCVNEKNAAGMKKCTIPGTGNPWEFDKLEYVKLISVSERQSREAGTKVFVVILDVKYKQGDAGGSVEPSGKYTWYYLLKRGNATSPWLICDWGGDEY